MRRLTLAGEGAVRERLVSLDDTDRSYTYDILESPFPVRSYRSTIRVAPITATGESFVEWWCHYDADGSDERRARPRGRLIGLNRPRARVPARARLSRGHAGSRRPPCPFPW